MFLGSKIMADSDHSHKIKRCLLLGRKAMTYLDNILKGETHFAHKGPYSQGYVVMYGCENWMIRKVEFRRIDHFELWWWRRLLRVPWTARRSSKSVLKEINPECSLEGVVLDLKLWYLGHLIWGANSLENTLIWEKLRAGRQGGDRDWDSLVASLTQWTWVWVNSRT